MENAIEAHELTKYYGELLAVDHVSFNVEKGEIFGFLGPNGAGKTTTVRMLTGISIPSGGWAKIMGYDIQRQPIKAKEQMGIVPDISNVYNELSAWDNLVFTGRLYDMNKADREQRAEELLQTFDLYHRRREKVQGYSRGMKRRLCIAMALINQSSILFLDEPTSGLDVRSVRTIRNIIRRMNQEGLTIFLTTHNMEEANQMCNRVAIINKGKIAAVDTPERLKRTIESLQSVEVAFEGKTVNVFTDLKTFSEVSEVVKRGDRFRIYTDDPPSTLSGLWKYARSKGLKPVTLNTLGPSLEDVFVKLTGGTPGVREEEARERRRGIEKGRGRVKAR